MNPSPGAAPAVAVAVVIVSYNGAATIRGCVASVAGASASGVHVIVVDNASSDGTAGIVAREFPGVETVVLPRNLGFGGGNNVGITKALSRGARNVLLLNQDACMPPGSLATLQRYLDDNPDVGACTPLHCSPDATRIDLRTHRGYLGPHIAPLLLDALQGRVQPAYPIPGINAAVWLVRADTFRRVGGFDPLYFMYGEDDDLLARMRHHGVRFMLLPHVVAVHLRQSPPSAPAGPLTRLRRRKERARSALLAAMKEPGHSASYAGAVIVGHGLLRPMADVVTDHDAAQCLATWWAALQVAFEMPRIRRHTRLTRRPGPHFLDIAGETGVQGAAANSFGSATPALASTSPSTVAPRTAEPAAIEPVGGPAHGGVSPGPVAFPRAPSATVPASAPVPVGATVPDVRADTLPPDVTVCVPTYNGADFIDQALASVRAQTYAGRLEVLIVDDASTDDTVARATAALQGSGLVHRVLCNPRNLGLVGNWNRCLAEARGRYLAFLFQDDWYEPTFLERMVGHADRHAVDLVLCDRHYRLQPGTDPAQADFLERRLPRLRHRADAPRVFATEEIVAMFLDDYLGANFLGEPDAGLVRRDAVQAVGGFDPALRQICDFEYWLRLASRGAVGFVPQALLNFRVHAASTTSRNASSNASVVDRILLGDRLLTDPAYDRLRAIATPEALAQRYDAFLRECLAGRKYRRLSGALPRDLLERRAQHLKPGAARTVAYRLQDWLAARPA